MFGGNGNTSWIEARMSDEWLRSSRSGTLFGIAVALHIVLISAFTAFVLSPMYDPSRPDLTSVEWIRIALGALGGATAIFAILLFHGMWAYWKRLDDSPVQTRKRWYWILLVGLTIASSLYYFAVYRPSLRRWLDERGK